jgi:hypothetical protein
MRDDRTGERPSRDRYGALAVQREARLIDPANPEAAQTKLLRLLKQHQAEWNAFMSSLPERSWVREIVGQL